jgi:hypothetical protein
MSSDWDAFEDPAVAEARRDSARLSFLLAGHANGETDFFSISIDYGDEWARSVVLQKALREWIDKKMEERK